METKRIAILTENGFEQEELTSPKDALENAGYIVHIVSPQKEQVKAWNHGNWGITLAVDKRIEDVMPEDYDALVLPGGVINPDKLRLNESAVTFAKEMLQSGKPVAAICHGPQTLIETRLLTNRQLTSYPSLQTDLKNAGANWQDREVVVDNNLITSRKPADLPAFNRELMAALNK